MSTYEERGTKFAKFLAELFANCYELEDFEEVISAYNKTHKNRLKYRHGVSRIAILRSDYVIKFNYGDEDFAGDCVSEARVYAKAVEAGMEHLLAKTTVLYLNGLICSVMPRIKGVGSHRGWNNLTLREKAWLGANINDLHRNNYGYKNRKICVVDYAWDAHLHDNDDDE